MFYCLPVYKTIVMGCVNNKFPCYYSLIRTLIPANVDYFLISTLCFFCFLFCFVFLIFVRWLLPFIGHMGIAMSSGVIRDFAGPYYVSVSYSEFISKGSATFTLTGGSTSVITTFPAPNFWECCPSLGTKSQPCTQAVDPALAPVCTQFL